MQSAVLIFDLSERDRRERSRVWSGSYSVECRNALVDIAGADDPLLVAELDVGQAVGGLLYYDALVYATAGRDLLALSLVGAAKPQVVERMTLPDDGNGVAEAHGHLLVAARAAGVVVVEPRRSPTATPQATVGAVRLPALSRSD